MVMDIGRDGGVNPLGFLNSPTLPCLKIYGVVLKERNNRINLSSRFETL